MIRLGLLALTLAACASAPKPNPEAPISGGISGGTASPAASAPRASGRQESLVSYVPASASAALVVRARALSLLRNYFAENPELQKELSEHFANTLGIDLTRIEGVVVSLTSIDPPSGALLLRISSPTGPLKLKELGMLSDVPIYRLGEYFAARVPAGVIVGTQPGVLEQIELAQGKRKPLDPDAPLARALGDASTIDTALAVEGSRVPQIGIERGSLTLGDDGRIALTLTGDSSKLQTLRGFFALGTQKMLSELEAERARATARPDPFAGAVAIASYYGAKKMVREIEPKLVGNQLVDS